MGTLLAEERRGTSELTLTEQEALLAPVVDRLTEGCGRILILPPDGTRANSGAGEITAFLYKVLSPHAVVDVMPTLGTHAPMTDEERLGMFGADIPASSFKVHDWRHNVREVGVIGAELMDAWSEGRFADPVSVAVDRLLLDDYDLILSVGQIVPHEVAGMANYTKNICVGAGGCDIINKSHFLGAVFGMERIMGCIDTPPRHLYNYAVRKYLSDLPVMYILTVVQSVADHAAMKGLYVGDDNATFERAARLSQAVNITWLEAPLRKALVYLDPNEFKSTWLGNKAIYRTRMAMADDGELIVLAPGLRTFGEDAAVDRLVRKYGYRGTDHVLRAVEKDPELRENLSAAAHLIHGSTEGRFRVTYCPGPGLSAGEIEAAGYCAGDLDAMTASYDPGLLRDGCNTLPNGEEIYFIRNPALGLWKVGSPGKS